MLFIKPRLWLVVDRLHPTDDLPHQYESLFHLDVSDVEVDPTTGTVLTTDSSGPNVALLPVGFDGWQIKIVKGQTEPTVQGWLPTAKHNVLRAVPTAVYHRQVAGDTTIAYVIAPLKPGEAVPRVTALAVRPTRSSESFAFEIVGPDDTAYTVLWNDRPGTPVKTSKLQTTARAAVFNGDNTLFAEIP